MRVFWKNDNWKNIYDKTKDLIIHLLCDEDKGYIERLVLNKISQTVWTEKSRTIGIGFCNSIFFIQYKFII